MIKRKRTALSGVECSLLRDWLDKALVRAGGPEGHNNWKLRGDSEGVFQAMITMHGADPARSVISRSGQSQWFYIVEDQGDRLETQVRVLRHLDFSQFSPFKERFTQVLAETGQWSNELPYKLFANEDTEAQADALGMARTRLRVGRSLQDPQTGYLYGLPLQSTNNLQTRKKSGKVTLLAPEQVLAIFNQAIAMRGMPLSGLRNAMREVGIEGKLDRDEYGRPVIINY